VIDVSRLSTRELLALYAAVMAELRNRSVTRSWNGPGGDLAEVIFCKVMGWTRQGNSSASFDAIGPDGVRYQIKSRRLTKEKDSRQLSLLRSAQLTSLTREVIVSSCATTSGWSLECAT